MRAPPLPERKGQTMNITQKSISRLLGIGLVALLSNSVLAHEMTSLKGDCGHSRGQEHGCGDGCGHDTQVDKHMSALHTALKLSSSQEAAWTEFSGKMKPVKMDMPGRQDLTDMNTPDRLDKMLDSMKSHEKAMAEHAATVRAFYDTLTQEQKKVFDKHFQERQSHHPHDKK